MLWLAIWGHIFYEFVLIFSIASYYWTEVPKQFITVDQTIGKAVQVL